MKYNCALISVADINAARKFYEDLFGLEVFQDYFDWLVHLPKENVLTKSNNMELCFAFLRSVDFRAFAVNVKTIAPKKSLYQSGHAI